MKKCYSSLDLEIARHNNRDIPTATTASTKSNTFVDAIKQSSSLDEDLLMMIMGNCMDACIGIDVDKLDNIEESKLETNLNEKNERKEEVEIDEKNNGPKRIPETTTKSITPCALLREDSLEFDKFNYETLLSLSINPNGDNDDDDVLRSSYNIDKTTETAMCVNAGHDEIKSQVDDDENDEFDIMKCTGVVGAFMTTSKSVSSCCCNPKDRILICDNNGNGNHHNNHPRNRNYRSNSTDSAIVLPKEHAEGDFNERFVSLDSACTKLKMKMIGQNNLDSGNLVSAMSCPSLDTPCVVISDHSTNHDYHHHHNADNIYDNEHVASGFEHQVSGECNAVLGLTIENLLNSHHAVLSGTSSSYTRRGSYNSLCSSTSSLSSLFDDDFSVNAQSIAANQDNEEVVKDENQSESHDCDQQLPARKVSAWRKVRGALHWSPFVQTYKRHKYPWVQLAGHSGNFKSGEVQGTILKKLCGSEEDCFNLLMSDALKPFVPEYKRVVIKEDEKFLELEDLLVSFDSPSIMDIKMGVRTYQEEELIKAKEKPKLRKDMYDKMVQIDEKEPTEEENELKAITKTRYMIWREAISSTANLGFRIEGYKLSNGKTAKDFKCTKTEEQVTAAIATFFGDNNSHIIRMYLEKLKEIHQVMQKSCFFKNHELIGSSLLFVHDKNKCNIWLIDFAKTNPVPDGIQITHSREWQFGNHEDGYLIGLESLIRIFNKL